MSLWFKHDAHFHEHPKCIRLRRLAGNKADSAELGWFRIIAGAKRLGEWTFEDEEHLVTIAGRYSGFLRLYREVGLLDGLTIHNAAEYQAPLSGAERVARHRSNATSVTPVVTPVTPREEKSRESREEQTRNGVTSSDGLPHLDDRATSFLETLTGRPITTAGDRNLAEYDRQIEEHGFPAVRAAYEKVAKSTRANPQARQVVWSALRILEPFVTPQDVKRIESQDRASEEERAHRARLEATKRLIAKQRGDAA